MSYSCYLCLFPYGSVKRVLTIWVTWRVSYKKQELLTLRSHLCSPRFFIGCVRVSHLFSFLCCVVFFAFVCLLFFFAFVLCRVYPMLTVSLVCPFLFMTIPSAFFNIYLVLLSCDIFYRTQFCAYGKSVTNHNAISFGVTGTC